VTGRFRAAAVVRVFLRFAIAAILLATGAGKLADVPGFAGVLATYEAFPEWALVPVAVAVPVAELLLSAWLFSGRRLAAAALASAGMHFLYAGWAAVTLARGIDVPNCGCFGVFLGRPLSYGTVLEDAGLAGASLLLALVSRNVA